MGKAYVSCIFCDSAIPALEPPFCPISVIKKERLSLRQGLRDSEPALINLYGSPAIPHFRCKKGSVPQIEGGSFLVMARAREYGRRFDMPPNP